ncbi:hypothetical protein PSTT_07583 [Puccinia striiformis]|uniref:Major facilitator superfamily (MFS) profile domain-containing protein n=1 Tax=Puccinia striiformis TaxID=27350 RepID=A0A2S4VFS8_9BASI|nr:hypothetical protein PSTT_07583 [Puccinia striiformis]
MASKPKQVKSCARPLIWGPLSELIGRLPVLLFTFGAYTLLQLGAALAPNLPVLLVSRALSGFFGSGPLTNSGAVLADMWVSFQMGFSSSRTSNLVASDDAIYRNFTWTR